MSDNTNIIVISVEEYRKLVEAKRAAEMLVNIILAASRLSYREKDLDYDDETITVALRAFNRDAVENRIEDLELEAERRSKNAG